MENSKLEALRRHFEELIAISPEGCFLSFSSNAVIASVSDLIVEVSQDPLLLEEIVPVLINCARIDFSVAHLCAIIGVYPKNFKTWEITCGLNGRDVSVAELGAMFDTLPRGFHRWDITDKEGWSVAHMYAALRDLPSDFTLFNLVTKDNVTVRDVLNVRHKKEQTK